ncbi:protein gp37 [Sphingomonas naasensis]|nr:DUF5131 family protein [Sphingomonas naasensis]NIJ18453.1 protein gp37 [Sphingomonas naasensis]
MTESKIEWTDRSDWNPVRGCTRVSPGCGGPGPHGGCYAEVIAGRFSDPGQAFHGFAQRTSAGGRWTGRVELMHERLTLPLGWRKPSVIFANSTSDFFHENLSLLDVAQIFGVAIAAHHLRGQPTHWFNEFGRLYAIGDPAATGAGVKRYGKSAAGRLLDGVQHDGVPA